MNSNKGFTLIELMAAVMVFGTLTALSLPAVSRSYRHWSGESAVDRFVQTAEYAREKAVLSGSPVRLSVDGAAGRISLLKRNEDASFVPLDGRWGKAFTLPEGLSIRTGSADVDFFPNGTSSTGEVIFSPVEGGERRFHLEPLLGHIKEER